MHRIVIDLAFSPFYRNEYNVTSQEGKELQRIFVAELLAKLETISPGSTKVLA